MRERGRPVVACSVANVMIKLMEASADGCGCMRAEFGAAGFVFRLTSVQMPSCGLGTQPSLSASHLSLRVHLCGLWRLRACRCRAQSRNNRHQCH